MKSASFFCVCLFAMFLEKAGAVEGLALDGMQFKRIMEGKEANPNQFPWIVEMLADRNTGEFVYHRCHGSLIGAEWVLTAASCMFFYSDNRKLILGEHDRLHQSGRETEHEIVGIRVHKDFLADGKIVNDIALLKISPPAHLKKHKTNIYWPKKPHPAHLKKHKKHKTYLKTIRLPKKNEQVPVGTNCVIAGWGATVKGSREYSTVLRYAEIPTVSYQTCASANDELGYSYVNASTMICAGDLSGKSLCTNDIGGPLACKNAHDEWILQGIMSWGGCDGIKYYTVSTRVSYFIDWIKEAKKTVESFPIQPPKECVDVHDYCSQWGKLDYCKWPSYIRTIYCRKTCGTCSPEK